MWLKEGYATEPLRIGESIVSVASSASVLYYEDIVTYPNNQSEPIEVIARPVPCFENGERLVMQRGAGFCTVKSTPERERAAAVFLKWLTEPETNVRFVTSVGYMPVTDAAFEVLPDFIENLEDPKYRVFMKHFWKHSLLMNSIRRLSLPYIWSWSRPLKRMSAASFVRLAVAGRTEKKMWKN